MKIVLPDPIPRPQLSVTAQGLISETFLRADAENALILTAQEVTGWILGLRAGDPVTNLHCLMSTTGSGAGYARMGLYDTDGAQLAITGDANAAFTGSAGLLTIALSAPYTVLADGGFYVCVLTDLVTTQPTLRSSANSSGIGAAIGAGSLSGVFQSTQASFPATATFAESGKARWFGVS